MMFKAGYKFKETHDEIHFVKNGHGERNDEYSENFTGDLNEGKEFETDAEAERCIMNLMCDFQRDNDYRWTPVIVDLRANKTRMIFSSKWH